MEIKSNNLTFLLKIYKFKIEFFLLFLLILFSFAVRWYKVDEIPRGIENDEMSVTIASYFDYYHIKPTSKGIWSLVETNLSTFPVTNKINQLSFIIFGEDIMSPRKILVVTSVLSLIAFYLLCRLIFSFPTTYVLLILYSFSPYKLITSRIPQAPPYSDLFIYPCLMLVLLMSNKNKFLTPLMLLLSGLMITLSILTYNLAYTFPFIMITIIIIKNYFLNINIKKTILYILIFLLPMIIFLPSIKSGIIQEANKSYALSHSFINRETKQLNFSNLINNLITLNKIMFKGLTYDTSDFTVRYSDTLVNRIIIILSILGIGIALVKFKKYYYLVIWLIGGVFIYQLLLGLYLPRMWFVNYGLIFLLAGVSIEFIIDYFKKQNNIISIILSILTVLIIAYILNKNFLNYHEALNNSSYLVSQREIYEIIKSNQKSIGKDVLFILPTLGQFPVNYVYSAVSFYYLKEHLGLAANFQSIDRQVYGVIDINEFLDNSQKYLFSYKKWIIDNQINSSINDILVNHNLKILQKKQYLYFTEYTF